MLRRRDAGTPLIPGGSHQDHVDHNTCVLTTRTLQSAVLDLAVVPSDSNPHCCRVRPGERGVSRRSGGCALGSRGQRIAGVARRPVVVVSISSGRRAAPDEVRGRGLASRFSGLQDAPSACQQVQRALPFGVSLALDEVFFYGHLCRVSLTSRAPHCFVKLLEQCTTPLDGGVPAGGPAARGQVLARVLGAPCLVRGAGRGTAVTPRPRGG